jgi:hypothetical protein
MVAHAKTTTPLFVMWLIPHPEPYLAAVDHNEVARRALMQILALRAWQLRHNGQFPERLSALVPDELPSLPNDPFSGQPFGYVRSHGREVPPLHVALHGALALGEDAPKVPPRGTRLLYSVGPDGLDDDGIAFKNKGFRSQPMVDIVFAIPPVAGEGGASKAQSGGDDKNRPAPPAVPPTPPGSGH